MDGIGRKVLRDMGEQLIKGLQMSQEILIGLHSRQVIEQEHMDTIQAQPSNVSQVYRLLTILPTRGPHAFQEFVATLEGSHPWLAKALREEYEKQTASRQPKAFSPGSATSSVGPPALAASQPMVHSPEQDTAMEDGSPTAINPLDAESVDKLLVRSRARRQKRTEEEPKMFHLYDMVYTHPEAELGKEADWRHRLHISDMSWDVMTSLVSFLLAKITDLTNHIEEGISYFSREETAKAQDLHRLIKKMLYERELLDKKSSRLERQVEILEMKMKQDRTRQQLAELQRTVDNLCTENEVLQSERGSLREDNQQLTSDLRTHRDLALLRGRTIDDLKKEVHHLKDQMSRYHRSFLLSGGAFIDAKHVSRPFLDLPQQESRGALEVPPVDVAKPKSSAKKEYTSPYRFRGRKKAQRKNKKKAT